MKKTIWKFEISPNNRFISMPADAEILTVQLQHGLPCVWALVNPDNPAKEKKIEIFGTGEILPSEVDLLYIGTFQMNLGDCVFHVFEHK